MEDLGDHAAQDDRCHKLVASAFEDVDATVSRRCESQYDFGSPRDWDATKLRTISRLTGAMRRRRTSPHRSASPNSVVMPLPPWVWMAASRQWRPASAPAYFAMLAASPAARLSRSPVWLSCSH